jgi:hypothetical protein
MSMEMTVEESLGRLLGLKAVLGSLVLGSLVLMAASC